MLMVDILVKIEFFIQGIFMDGSSIGQKKLHKIIFEFCATFFVPFLTDEGYYIIEG